MCGLQRYVERKLLYAMDPAKHTEAKVVDAEEDQESVEEKVGE